ncbi:hypothetical protein VNO80_35309 [Phaseolus coccineus]
MNISTIRKDFMIVNMGPHHPSMHGVLRLIVTLDGEDVIDCEPILGYLHRGMEKIAENRTIIQYLPYVTRWDYLATMFTEAITVNGPEQLGNIQVPQRASYIRVIMLELSRIASHLLWLGPFMADIGAQTPFFYIFREREFIYDLFEAATGMRMMHNFFRIGGVATDLPYGWVDKCYDFCDYFLTSIAEYQKLITRNPIFLERVEGVGVVDVKEVINWGLSGPMLRASGIQWDLRKVDNYECYEEFHWEVQWQKEGDSLARYLVRIGEMVESIKIIQQALEGLPGGPYENLEIRCFDREKEPEWNEFEYRFISKKSSPSFELPKQELYKKIFRAIHDMFLMVTEFINYSEQIIRAARYIGQGLMITLSHANRLPVTIQYPYEKIISSERFRGRIHFEFDKCIACEVCVRVCPIDLPIVDWKLETDIRKKRLLNYSIDFGICIFCGNCIEYCPTNCLSMTEEYELSTYDRHELNYNLIALGRLPVSVIDDYTIRTIQIK